MNRLLVVCTANLVRSPVTAAALTRWSKGSDGTKFDIDSAGISARNGEPVPQALLAELRSYFLDLHEHRSRRVTRHDVRESSLILAMTEEHRAQLQVLLPSATPRTFTLREFVRLAEQTRPFATFDGDFTSYVQAVHHRRPRCPAPPAPEDVEDPFGASARKRQACISDLVGLVDRVTDRLAD